MVGRCCRLRRCVSITLMLLTMVGFAVGSLRAQEPAAGDEDNSKPETPEQQDHSTDSEPAPDAGAGAGELEGPEPPFIKAFELEQAGWAPVAPMPVKFDWIMLKSGEWLKGEFIALYDDQLEFDSDELDLLELDWADVRQVRTAQVMDVAFMGDARETGRLWIEGSRVRVINAEGVRTFKRSKIISITTGAKSEWKKWKGKVSMGATFQRGNTDKVDLNNQMSFKRRTIENRLNVDFIANYGQVSGIDTANNQRANANWDKFLTIRFFVEPAIFEWYRDPFKNISSRTTYSVGAGYQVADTKRTDWNVSGGLGYQETHFDSVQPGDDEQSSTPAVIFESDFDQDWTKDIEFIFTYRAQFTNSASGKYNHHMVATVETEWTSLLDFDISFVWDRTEKPQPDSQGVTPLKDDYRLIFALGIEF